MMATLKHDPSLNLSAVHKAFAFQKEAIGAVKDREYAGVFHEQGLGKTKIAIDVLLHWLSVQAVDSVIVVTKKGLLKLFSVCETKSRQSPNSYLAMRNKVCRFRWIMN